ncbi:MAG: hypothetical protein LAT83_04830 [Kiritimatiellae bacterium]|nr:hypothetical protein [Kiritimatiellia bacterium]
MNAATERINPLPNACFGVKNSSPSGLGITDRQTPSFEFTDLTRYESDFPGFQAYAQRCISFFDARHDPYGSITPSMYGSIAGETRSYTGFDPATETFPAALKTI